MGVLLHDVGKPVTFRIADRIRFDGHVEAGIRLAQNILSRLRFSNADCEQILALIQNHMRFMDVGKMRESTVKRFIRLPKFDEHLALHRLDVLNSNGRLEAWELLSKRYAETPEDQLKPPLLINGNDLIEAGFKPGPRFKKILAAVEDAQLEGALSSKEEALRFARRKFGK